MEKLSAAALQPAPESKLISRVNRSLELAKGFEPLTL
jgi:hypothetical protein